jgi:hypothetical protein
MKEILTEWRQFINEFVVTDVPPDYEDLYQKEKKIIDYYRQLADKLAKDRFGLSMDDCVRNEKCGKELEIEIEGKAEILISALREKELGKNPRDQLGYTDYVIKREKDKGEAETPSVIEKQPISKQVTTSDKKTTKNNYWDEHFARTCHIAVDLKLVSSQEYNKCYNWMKANPKKCPSGMKKHRNGECIPLTQNEKQLLTFRRKIEDWINNQS